MKVLDAALDHFGTPIGIGLVILLLIVIFGPWITHVVWCIQYAAVTGSAIALLIVGVIIPPVGWVHGVCLWFGFTWI